MNAKIDQRVAELNAKIETCIAGLRTEPTVKIATLDASMERRFTEQNRWLIGMLATMILGFLGLGVGLVGLWLRHG